MRSKSVAKRDAIGGYTGQDVDELTKGDRKKDPVMKAYKQP